MPAQLFKFGLQQNALLVLCVFIEVFFKMEYETCVHILLVHKAGHDDK